MPDSSSATWLNGKMVVIGLLASMVLLIVGMTSARIFIQRPLQPLPDLGQRTPELILESPTGQTRPLSDFSGKILLLDIQPNGCMGPCEIRNRLMNSFSHMNEPVGASLVQLTLREKPYPHDLLKSRSQTARPPWYWYLVEPTDMQALLALKSSPDAQEFLLLDRSGALRGRYPVRSGEKQQELMLDIRSLVVEPR